MKFIITGGAGFIGSHICEMLLKKQHKVVCIDNFTKNDIYISLKELNLSFLKPYKNFEFINLNILNKINLFKYIKTQNNFFLIHCAAKAGVRNSLIEPFIYSKVNILGTQNILEALRIYKRKAKIIILSSSSVYGTQINNEFSEDMTPNPKSIYATSKYAMELIAKQYYDFYKIPSVIIRPFSIYGIRGRIDMTPFLMIRAAELNKTFIKFGSNKDNKRDWTYIDDFITGIWSIIKNNNFSDFNIFNFGKSKPIGIDHFISVEKKLIKKYLNKDIIILEREREKEELPVTHANINKAKIVLGYKPKIDIEVGLDNVLKYYLQNRNIYLKIFRLL